MRVRLSTLAAVTAVTLTGCIDGQPLSPPEPEPDLGTLATPAEEPNGSFHWLPPLGAIVPFSGVFDPTLEPAVTVCLRRDGACSGPPVANFTTGPGPDRVKVSLEDEHYHVNWHTRSSALEPGGVYRIAVTVDGRELGVIDVAVAGRGRVKGARGDGAPLIRSGRTLPIKFRIEEGALADPLSEGLLVHYDFGGTPGAGLRDRSGNGNDAALFGDPVWIEGRDGGALSFDGDDFARAESWPGLAALGSPGRSWSVTVLLRTDWPPTANPEQHLVSTYSSERGNATTFAADLLVDGDGITYGTLRHPQMQPFTGSAGTGVSLVDGAYHHIVWVADASVPELRMYLGDRLVQTGSYDPTLDHATATPLFIAAHYWAGRPFGFYRGDLDDVRIYERALGSDDVAALCRTLSACD